MQFLGHTCLNKYTPWLGLAQIQIVKALVSFLASFLFFRLGVASFVFGFHFSLSRIKALQSIKIVLTLMVIGVIVIWIFVAQGWDKDILESSYAMMFAKMTTKFSVLFLNFFGIHATQN